MKKERILYLDLVRVIALLLVIFTHFNAVYIFSHPEIADRVIISSRFFNLYTGELGVTLFLVISGAALMYTYEQKCETALFYKKRFLSIYPMFWIGYILYFLFAFYIDKIPPVANLPKTNIIYTVIGMDCYLNVFGIQTFSIIGEWFIGFIVIFYVVFPALRFLVNKYPLYTLMISIIICVSSIIIFEGKPYSSVLFTTRILELEFGMYFIKFIKKVNWKMVLAAIIVLGLQQVLKPEIPENAQVIYVGIAAFMVLVFISYYIKCTVVNNVCRWISKYSYAVFLIHHIVIIRIMNSFELATLTLWENVLLLILCIVASFVAGYALFHLHKKIMGTVFTKETVATN